jgi:hypothetical protein
MRKVTIYISELGGSFDNREDAIKDDKRLPSIIEDYKNNLSEIKEGNMVAGRVLTKAEAESLKELWEESIDYYFNKWQDAQNSWINPDND